jgi:general secretion pathway protein B
MSYILEALKKAQAERQLGALPTIHAPPPQAAVRSSSKLLWLALAASLALVLLLLLWRQPWRVAPQPVPEPELVQAPELDQSVKLPPVAQPPKVAQVQAPRTKPPAANDARAVAQPSRAASSATAPQVAPLNTERAKAVVDRAPDVRAPLATALVQPVGAAEESVPALRELPEPIQRQIPALVIGGYIYSKNPEDRLLLVDKALRREGEQVAPGLILEKLRPTSAVFNYNGYRYRIAY